MRGSSGPVKPAAKDEGCRRDEEISMESALDSFPFLVWKNMSLKGKYFGSDILTDAQDISLLVPGEP